MRDGLIYLSGAVKDELLALGHPRIGAMFQPNSYGPKTWDKWPMFAGDSGGFGGKFDPRYYLPFADGMAMRADRCLFLAVPDRFDPTDIAGNFAATQEMWELWAHEVTDRGLPAAWVAQNGATPDDIPPDASAVFIGGDDTWKTSERAWAIVAAAKARSLWVHIGRVNGIARFRAGSMSMADSVDGNKLKYGYDENIRYVLAWLDQTECQPHLSLFGGAA